MKTDGLTVITSQPLIAPEKIQDKTLDQMTLPERTELLRKAYILVEDDEASEAELEVIGKMSLAVDEKLLSWGVVVRKAQEASELCNLEVEYFKKKLDEAKSRQLRLDKKAENMSEFIRKKMIEFNKKKVESSLVTVSLRKKKRSVIISDDADINNPENKEFTKTTVETVWDKKKIAEELIAAEKLTDKAKYKTVKFSEPDFTISIKGK